MQTAWLYVFTATELWPTRLAFLVLPSAYTAKTPAPIFTVSASNDVVSRKDVHFGGLENKILYFDPILPFPPPPKKTEIWGKFLDGTKNFASKGLNNGDAHTCKLLPLIVIVAP